MAGLLDIFNQRDPNDPVNMGLLNMSAALGTPVRQGGGVGPAFGAFGQGYQSAQQAEMRRKLMDAQIEETRAQAMERLKPRKEAPIPVAGGYIDPATGQFVRTELPKDKEPASTELAKLVRERDALPPNSPARTYYDDAIRKATTHAPQQSTVIPLTLGDQVYGLTSRGPNPGGLTGPLGPAPTKQGPAEKSPGQDAVDRAFAKEYVDWVGVAGYADVEKQIRQLDAAAAALESDKSLTGPVVGAFPDLIRSVTNPQAVNVKNNVEESVQRALRTTLGAQFTEKEGENFLKRAFNPSLGTEVNAARVRALSQMLRTVAQTKNDAIKYFDEHGTLKGFAGKSYTLADFEDRVMSIKSGNAGSANPSGGAASLRKQAEEAIARGAPRDKVAERFKQQTGQDF